MGIKIEPAKVTALSEEIRSKSSQIKGHLTTLDSDTARLRNAWDGEAKNAYHQAQTDWNTKIGEMEALLTKISGKLGEIAADYIQTDKKGANRFM
jgi:6 kDa early secretory antigenic target